MTEDGFRRIWAQHAIRPHVGPIRRLVQKGNKHYEVEEYSTAILPVTISLLPNSDVGPQDLVIVGGILFKGHFDTRIYLINEAFNFDF